MSLQSVINADVDVDADAGVEYSTSGLQHHDSDLEDQPPNENQEQNWLTIRRRCELCKQRKVRVSAIRSNTIRARAL